MKSKNWTRQGYTAIANEIMEALAKIRIPGIERQCLDFILRKTYGFNKKSDIIAIKQFVKGTGLKKQHISRALKGLSSKKVIRVTNIGNKNGNLFEFNTYYNTWEPSPKKVTYPKKVTGVTKKGYRSYPILGTTKVDSTKVDTKVDKDIVEYLNQKTGKSFKWTSKETQKLIQARINAGFTKNDFFAVIDNQCAKWLTDPKMIDYLRPQTLFGTKFESYLQSKPHPLHGRASQTTVKNLKVINDWRPNNG